MAEVKVIRSHGSAGAVMAELEVDGVRIWVAFHSERVVANGWEPYDQPDPAAYVPLGNERVHRVSGAGGDLVVSRESERVKTPSHP